MRNIRYYTCQQIQDEIVELKNDMDILYQNKGSVAAATLLHDRLVELEQGLQDIKSSPLYLYKGDDSVGYLDVVQLYEGGHY